MIKVQHKKQNTNKNYANKLYIDSDVKKSEFKTKIKVKNYMINVTNGYVIT